jgi:hypothetical protein
MAEAGKPARAGHALVGLTAADNFAEDAAFARPAHGADDDRSEKIEASAEPQNPVGHDQNEPVHGDLPSLVDAGMAADRAAYDGNTGAASDLPPFAYPEESDGAGTVDPSPEEPAVVDATEHASGEATENPDDEWPIAGGENVLPDDDFGSEPADDFVDVGLPADEPRLPDLAPRGHSLRARIVQTPQSQSQRATFGERIVAFLQWLEGWLTRRRK